MAVRSPTKPSKSIIFVQQLPRWSEQRISTRDEDNCEYRRTRMNLLNLYSNTHIDVSSSEARLPSRRKQNLQSPRKPEAGLQTVSIGAFLPSPALVRLVVLAHAQPSRLSTRAFTIRIPGKALQSLPRVALASPLSDFELESLRAPKLPSKHNRDHHNFRSRVL